MDKHIFQWLAAYHDGELRGRRLAQVEAHLARCPECRAELEQLASLSALLGAAPEAPTLTPPDRFAAQVGMRLSRRRVVKSRSRTGQAWVWAAMPVSIVVGLAFLQVVQWLAASLSLAQLFGYGEAAVERLTTTPVEPTSVWGQLSTELIRSSVPFSPQIWIGLILPAVLAVAYMLWLVVWGLNQQEVETR
jgi:predicted anti-sigma-YlaC factor YlaD